MPHSPRPSPARPAAAAALCLLLLPLAARAQLSLPAAVDLALRNNPRLKIAQADLARARAQLAQTHDVYIPSVNAGAGLGYAYGYSPYPPTLFTFNSGSLLYNPSQIFYIRSARAGVDAAQHSFDEARDAVSEDTAQAYLALQHDQQRLDVIAQQSAFAKNLVDILQARLEAGQASPIDLTQARLTQANLRLALLHATNEVGADRDHLARIMGISPNALVIDTAFPAAPQLDPDVPPESEFAGPAVAAAYANALARQLQATGDAKFRFRPNFNLAVQYNRYATFTESFRTLKISNPGLTANEYVLGVQITVPLYDRYRQAKARESAADASHALHDAENAKLNALDAQSRLRHGIPEIETRAQIAQLQQQLAQQQLDIVRVQLQAGNPNGPVITPADEQNARIAERDKYLAVLDADFQLHTTQLQLLRLTGRLNPWLKSTLLAPVPAPTSPNPTSSPNPNQHSTSTLPPAPTPQ
ncbi:MAG: TolC family protein [Acidobacteriota bacterium]|nr:TolC family protein [Acidobacteriota bacterium]